MLEYRTGAAAMLAWLLTAAAAAPADATESATELLQADAMHATEPDPDRAGLRRDTKYVFSYQFASIGILYVLPESISSWSEEQKEEYSLGKWWDNVRSPTWDQDDFWINYIAHPYWGAAYYVRARERGFDQLGSFWYSAFMSTAYEFGAEALFEQPSIQDLVVTPVGGAIVGEYFMSLRTSTRSRYAAGEPMLFRDRALLALTDPLGAINAVVQSWLGVDMESSFYPYIVEQRLGEPSPFSQRKAVTDRVYGLQLNYRW